MTTENRNFQYGWVAEPHVNFRGTASIIYTCFFTIYACTWTALHLNVNRRGLSHYHKFFRKMQWMFIAILAPEYISLTALAQRSSTVTALSDAWPLEDRSRALVFYALMGGFELCFEDKTYHRLKYSEFRGLVRARFADAPQMTAEDVQDKSKGSWFTKSLAMLEIGWFVAQLLGRVVQRLETTPLELFVLSAVACTLVSYVNWWAKPLDVSISTAITVASASTLAKPVFFAPLEVYRWKEGALASKVDSWLDALRTFVPSFLASRISEQQASGSLASELQAGIYDDRLLPKYLALHLQKPPHDILELLGGRHLLTSEEIMEWERIRDGIVALRSIDRAISRVDLEQWDRRRDWLAAAPTKDRRPRPKGVRPEGFWSDAFFEDRVVHTSSSLGLILTCLVFGACHLLAWNYSFPSTVERILWRVMSISCPIVPIIILVVDDSAAWRNQREAEKRARSKREDLPTHTKSQTPRTTTSKIANYLPRFSAAVKFSLFAAITSDVCSMLFVTLYLIIRLYLLVAVLCSLRLVPASVYATVNWSLYIPHFG